MPRTYQSAEDSARTVWAAIKASGRTGVTRAEMITRTGLTRSQVGTGINRANRMLQTVEGQPLAYRPQDYRYFLPRYYPEARDDELRRVQELLTRLRTVQAHNDAVTARFAKQAPTMAPKQLTRLIEDLEDLADTLVASGSSMRTPNGKA